MRENRAPWRLSARAPPSIDAARLGYDYAWEVEHHFLEESSHSSSPEVFLGAASQRTKQIRLAHGIIQLTTNHPARVAERVSTLDLLSHGRVEFGIGEGSSVTERHPFGRRFRDKRAVWEDAVRAVIPIFGDGPCEYHGEYFDFPLRNVLPKPLQKLHPPIWVACSQLETIEMAGRRGLGALGDVLREPVASKRDRDQDDVRTLDRVSAPREQHRNQQRDPQPERTGRTAGTTPEYGRRA